MKFVSYAQNFEDVMLWRALKHLNKGFYIDIGAAWEDNHSVTKAFYDKGWTGINIEPNIELFRSLNAKRTRDINLNLAVGDKSKESTISIIQDTGLSTLVESVVKSYDNKGFAIKKHKIRQVTLQEIWKKYVSLGQEVHFLKIDAEGYEEKIIFPMDWNIYRPWIIVVESTLPLSKIESHHKWEKFILQSGYRFAYFDGLNRFYVAKEHQKILNEFSTPPNVFDDFILYDTKKYQERMVYAESRVVEVENQIRKLKSSFSWKVTAPLRFISLQNLVCYIINISRTLLLKHPRIVYKIKPLVKKNYILWKKANELYFNRNLQQCSNLEYIVIPFREFDILFSSIPLRDMRGIGRVSQELLLNLQHLSKELYESQIFSKNDNRSKIYFYSSIHWCPKKLPKNSVILIHDVIPLIFKQRFPAQAVEWDKKFKAIALQASQLITISHTSADDISKHLNISRDLIKVIHNGVKKIPINRDCKVRLPQSPFLLFLGSMDKHKNIEIVFKAMQDINLSHISLVMIGDCVGSKKLAKKYDLSNRIHVVGRLKDSDVGYAMSKAIALVFPSLYEGFGLPPLEAASVGTPSICSSTAIMHEIMGDAALFANPYCEKEWVGAITRLLKKDKFYIDLKNRAQERLNKFDWKVSAAKYLEEFQKHLTCK